MKWDRVQAGLYGPSSSILPRPLVLVVPLPLAQNSCTKELRLLSDSLSVPCGSVRVSQCGIVSSLIGHTYVLLHFASLRLRRLARGSHVGRRLWHLW